MSGGTCRRDNSPLKNVASAAEARKNEAKKRSLHGVNEHFEPNFDDASASAVVFQRADNPYFNATFSGAA
jgi:hypothetical protein